MSPVDNLEAFVGKCRLWSDDYLREEHAKGESAYADERYFAAIRDEVSRRGLSIDAAVTASPPPGDEAADGASLFSSLWRGQVSLPETYWVWGVLINLVLRVTILATREPLHSLALLLGVIAMAYSPFIAVAIWRSATNYRGQRVWAVLAKIVVGIGVVRWLLALIALARL